MEKKIYITEEERKKCQKVADAFAELEDVDVVVVDAGRYGRWAGGRKRRAGNFWT